VGNAYAVYALNLIATPLITYIVYLWERKLGLLAHDVFKKGFPTIPGMGGVSLLAISLIDFIVFLYLRDFTSAFLILALVIAGLLGLYDDFRDIDAKMKVLVFTIPALPVVLSKIYVPRPFIPLVGELRLTIVYPLLLLIGYTVACNALNMADTHNGLAPASSIMIISALITSALLPGPKPLEHGLEIAIAILIALIAYMPFNMYPAKLLNGNVGSFLLGAATITVAIALRREFLLLLLMVPLGLNGFSILTSIKGFINRTKIGLRPVYLDNELRMHASPDPRAPVTLVQLLTLKVPLNEMELIVAYLTLIALNTAISLVIYHVLTVLI
jgi:UDP-N-acetylmuramyl pentapeptide phosphotransferase/UDP-N-acetylglucosamine-1-phosphate transferase